MLVITYVSILVKKTDYNKKNSEIENKIDHDHDKYIPSRQILVSRTSWGRPLSTSPARPLKILFDVLKWRPGDVLIWHSGDVPGRLILDVPRTFSGRQDVPYRSFKACFRDNVGSSVGCRKIYFFFSFGTYSIVQIYLKVIKYSRFIENPVEILRWSIFCEISEWLLAVNYFHEGSSS